MSSIVQQVEDFVKREEARVSKLAESGVDEVSVLVQEAKADVDKIVAEILKFAKSSQASAVYDPQPAINADQERILSKVRDQQSTAKVELTTAEDEHVDAVAGTATGSAPDTSVPEGASPDKPVIVSSTP